MEANSIPLASHGGILMLVGKVMMVKCVLLVPCFAKYTVNTMSDTMSGQKSVPAITIGTFVFYMGQLLW